MERLQDKVIIVAGCGGIGDELARRYASEGARLVLADLREDHAKALAKELDPTGERAVGTGLDGGDDASVAAMVRLAVEKFGRLDGMHVNFADVGDAYHQVGVELPLEVFDESIRVNVRGYFLCSRQAIPAMVASGGGSIVYTSSVEAFKGTDIRFAYAMAKSGIHGLMRNVAVRYGVEGIRANAICPGFIGHEKLRKNAGEAAVQSAMARNALKSRVGASADIAAMGAYLLSDEAGYVTGQVMAVDGGLTMRP